MPHYLIVKTREQRVIYHRWDKAGWIETGSQAKGRLELSPPGMKVEIGAWFG